MSIDTETTLDNLNENNLVIIYNGDGTDESTGNVEKCWIKPDCVATNYIQISDQDFVSDEDFAVLTELLSEAGYVEVSEESASDTILIVDDEESVDSTDTDSTENDD